MARGPAGAAFLSVPILLGVGMFVAGVGLFAAVQFGFTPQGGLARYRFQSTCELEARAAMLQRLADFGLPAQAFGAGLDLQVQLPGVDDDELDHLPRALARPGKLEVFVDGQPFPVTLRNAGFQLSVTTGAAVTLITVDPAPPESGVEVRVDGVAVGVESSNAGELQLLNEEKDPRRAIREATERAVALRYPIPCPVVLAGAEKVDE